MVQSILLAGWIGVYFRHKSLKSGHSNEELNDVNGHQPYRDFDPYLSTIFRKPKLPFGGGAGNGASRVKELTPGSSPEHSLDLVQRKLILTHIEDKKRRNI